MRTNEERLCGHLSECSGNQHDSSGEPQVTRIDKASEPLTQAPVYVGGRALVESMEKAQTYTHQWPGVYFETAFHATRAYFTVGSGEVILQVIVDGQTIDSLTKPSAGLYRVDGLPDSAHVLRVEVSSESQARPDNFRGFALPNHAKPLPMPRRSRQIEFIVDSHTVGYANTSLKRDCTSDEVWSTTNTTQAFGPITARRYGADYQVNAISGRGIVRNYNGGAGATLPAAYPYTMLDPPSRYEDAEWNPQIVVIALGTNDFSTPLNPEERWKSREDLRSDYGATYLKFIQSLRSRRQDAFFILWAADGADGEIQQEVEKVAAKLHASGEQKLAFIPVNGLEMTACHWHPSLADNVRIAEELTEFIDARPELWRGR
jgi:lysophospholipase L1-like esterase